MSRFAGGQALSQKSFDVFDDNDGVVNDDADGEHQPKQRQVVKGIPKPRENGERPDQRDRDGKDRDD